VPPKLALAVDCGAGIGRVTEGFLAKVAERVDAVEPVAKFADAIAAGPLSQKGGGGVLGDVYVQSLQDWDPAARGKKYDLIWNQWCVGHLTDAQLTAYLARCIPALSPQGWIVVKENISTHELGEDIYDVVDSSVTRSDAKFRCIFEQAGLKIVKTELQTGFPRILGLYPVRMYALRPK